MGAVKVIINKELKVAFNSLLIYIAYTAFLCVTGFVCWFSGKNIFSSGQASLSNLFNVFYWTLFFLIPALTMKSISEERKDGTFELLFSKPIKTWQLIMGKFVAFFITFAIEIGFVVLFEFIAELWGSGFMAALFTYLSIGEHFDAIPRGVIDTKDLIYFISVIIIFLALARHYICKNRF